MDSRLHWLESVSHSGEELAPPPVSFGFSSNTELQKTQNHYVFTNVLADNIAARNNESSSPESIPLSLTAQELTLEESKTYMRWYSDILARTNLRTITMADVCQFLNNFRLSAGALEKISRIFSKILSLINIGEFFALLRVVSHALDGKEPSRMLIKVKTVVPLPPSILLKKRQNDEDDEPKQPEAPQPSAPLDLDLFTQFMLTGERPEDRAPKKRLKKMKSVKFSDQIVSDIHDMPQLQNSSQLDYLLPMDQLLSKMAGRNVAFPNIPRPVASPDPEEKQILKDMESQINHFRNLNSVDTMLVDGVPSNIHLHANAFSPLPQGRLLPQLLKPNMTGPAQMAKMGYANTDPNMHSNTNLDTNMNTNANVANNTMLRPNATGPADMARFLPVNGAPSISLQSFTDQMTDTFANTASNARIGSDKELPPPPIPATRRVRSMSQPNPTREEEHNHASGADENGYGYHLSAPNFLAEPDLRFRSASLSPVPPIPPRSPQGRVPPPPPPSRRRGGSTASSPQPPESYSIDSIIRETPPTIPPKTPLYQHTDSSSSTTNILDDLKALQEEVDKIRDMTGGF